MASTEFVSDITYVSFLFRSTSLHFRGRSARTALGCSSGFEEEPDALFRFVYPVLQQTCGRYVVRFAAEVVNFAHLGKNRPVVFAQFGEHIERIDILRIVIAEALQAANVADRSNRSATDFAHALGDIVGHRKNLAGLLIEQEVVVPKVRSADVPVKVLGLYIESKYISQQRV